MNFLSTNFINNSKKLCDVVIFDDTNSELIKTVLPKKFSVLVFKTRPVEFIFSFYIVVNVLRNLKFLRPFKKFTANKNFITNILWQLLCIYIKSYIELINPKAVITSIDNCTKFAWLSKNINRIPFISVQNGFRLAYDVDKNCIYNSHHMFCFGNYEIEAFPKRGWQVKNYYPVGSLNASLNFKKFQNDLSDDYDLLIVSCWRGNIGYEKDVQDSMKAMKFFDEDLADYISNNNIKAAVIMRSERLSSDWFMPEIGMNEEEYFYSIYGNNVELIDVDFNERNVYKYILKSNLILASFPSTCLLEALGVGKKVLYCDYTKNEKYFSDMPEDIVFKSNNDNFLHCYISKILKDENLNFKKICNTYKNIYMCIDPSLDTKEAIEGRLLDII